MTEHRVSSGGGVVYWGLGSDFPIDDVREVFRIAGVGSFAPNPRTQNERLRAAITDIAGDNNMVVPSANGYDLIYVSRSDKNYYSVEARVVHSADGYLIDHCDMDSEAYEYFKEQLERRYEHAATRCSASTLGTALARTVRSCFNGTTLRPHGAMYWIPEGYIGAWQSLTKGLKLTADRGLLCEFYLLRTRIDEDSLLAVRDGLAHEIGVELAGIRSELGSDDKPGKRALQNRVGRVEQMLAKVRSYEGHLGQSLATISMAVEECKKALLVASLEAASSY